MDYFFHEICDRVESYSVVRYNVFRNSTRSRRKLVSAALYPWRVRRTRPGSVENRQRWHSTETETVMGFSSGIEGKRQLQMPSSANARNLSGVSFPFSLATRTNSMS